MDYWRRIRQLVGKEQIIMPGAAGGILRDGKILLVRRKSSTAWQIPGGVQEPGESIQQTAQREMKEELGLDLAVRHLVGVYSSPRWAIEYPDGQVQQLTCFFLMEGQIEQIEIQESEVAAYGFFAPNEIPENTWECCKQKVIDLMNFNGRTVFR